MKPVLIIIIGSASLIASSQTQFPYSIPEKALSYMPYRDFPPCFDTLKVMWIKKEIDMGLALPEWNPVRGHDDNVIFEGKVIKTPNSVAVNTHVSQEDMPIYHYTYDFSFNAVPDEYPDNRYRNLLSLTVKEKIADGVVRFDTSEQEYLHMEWEIGLAAGNKGNICSEANRKGKSCGFYSAGHERGDTIWNWPSIGDWVHVEGLWIWDRGHPPAETEIHPIRFIATRRQLPEKIRHPDKPDEYIWATRVDIFASGEGGALYNNRLNNPAFVHKVKMGEKDYSLNAKSVIDAPSANAQLRYAEVAQKGNTFEYPLSYSINKDGGVGINIPWHGKADTLVLAKTVYLYWDEGSGKAADYAIHRYKVTLQEMRFHNKKEFLSRHEMRAFVDVGGKWFFLNELFGKKDIINGGKGKSYGKRWKLDLSFVVNIPYGTEFRIHANSWECDGIDGRMGILMDSYSPCNEESKKKIRKALNIISPLRFKGCMNDLMGEVHDFYTPETIEIPLSCTSHSFGNDYEDICICNKDVQNDVMSLKYTIEKIGVE